MVDASQAGEQRSPPSSGTLLTLVNPANIRVALDAISLSYVPRLSAREVSACF